MIIMHFRKSLYICVLFCQFEYFFQCRNGLDDEGFYGIKRKADETYHHIHDPQQSQEAS